MKDIQVRCSVMHALVLLGVPATTAVAASTPKPSEIASFEGQTVRLADGWVSTFK